MSMILDESGRWATILALTLTGGSALAAPVQGWLAWRGPEQSGVSRETGLPAVIQSKDEALWAVDFAGKSTPVIADGRLFILGYQGEGSDLQEGVGCFDAETGKFLWKRGFNDYISDTIYERYSTSSPAVDPETGNVFMQGTQGMLAGFTPDGELLWRHSLMEMLGRLTFPNGRTASPLVDGDLVITRGITSNWGNQGAASDRFYAFDKSDGHLVWASTPGDRPKDNSFSHPYLGWFRGKRVLYSATGDGSVVCVNARTGDPLWRVPLAKAGISVTVLVHPQRQTVVAIYGTPYEPGEMVAMRIPDVEPAPGQSGPVVVDRQSVELWANDLSTSASSPILVGDTIYVVKEKGELVAVDVATGKIAWGVPLGIEQRNSSPLFADGRIYVPILDNPTGKDRGASTEAGTKGGFYIIEPSAQEGKILSHIELEGRCFGTPVAYNGKIYVQTAKKLYCFGRKGDNPGLPAPVIPEPWPKASVATQLQIVPSEVVVHPGEKAAFRVRKLDANGFLVEEVRDVSTVKWASYIPPTALVKARMDGSFNAQGELVVPADAGDSAGAWEATLDGLKGYMRGRALRQLPFEVDFEGFELSTTTTNTAEPPTPYAYPPLPWIGARFKFEVREVDGTKALTKTIDNKFFQRAMAFIGAPGLKNYTMQADVRSEGNRRKMSEVGLVNQRYLIVLKGNAQELEVTSNQERLRVAVPFRWAANTWYSLKSRVDVAADGTGVVRAKAWKRGDPEPETWTIEVPHRTAHTQGAPGLFGFAPQEMRVFIDNLAVTAN
ncbi:MAG: PQQ-binding-like beta-propeller repeat protein [Limisphaerales bacterium]